MNKREKNKLRTRVIERLSPHGLDEARSAWATVWRGKPAGATNAAVDRARFAMLVAIDEGKTIAEAQKAAADDLARGG